MAETKELGEAPSINGVIKQKIALYDYFVRAFKDVGFPALVAAALWWQSVTTGKEANESGRKMTEAFNGLQKAVAELTEAIKKGPR